MKEVDRTSAIIRRGQWVHCILYGGMDGVVVDVHGEQKPETVKSIWGGVGVMGGSAHFDIVFHDHVSRMVPESIVRGVQWHVFDDYATDEKIAAMLQNVERIEAENKEKARLDAIARDEERVRIRREFSYLTTVDQAVKKHGPTLAAQNIRTELKRTFPGVKFSVKSRSFSGGDDVTISWADGPSNAEVVAITGKYQEGHFNGMEDLYEYNRSVWVEVFGGAKYVSENRHYSREFVEKIAAAEGISVKWNTYGCYEVEGDDDYEAMNSRRSRLHSELNKTSAYVTPTTPEPVQVDGVTVTENTEKNGIEIRFPSRPDQAIIDGLKAHGWRWSRFGGCWYHRATDENRAYAQSIGTREREAA